MPPLRLSNFGGMLPAVDPNLLPDNQAQYITNAWLYRGTIEGLREPVLVHTFTDPLAKKVYRIPIQYNDKDHIPDSYWLEFQNTDVDVISTPVVNDTFNRYYWAFSQTGGGGIPQYNTKDRIIAGQPAYTLGIPRPSAAPLVTRVAGKYTVDAYGTSVKVAFGTGTQMYYSRAYGQDSDSFGTGGAKSTDPSQYGATQAISSTRGNMDLSATPGTSVKPANRVTVAGKHVEMRYGTVQAGLRITISDTSQVTLGTPAVIDPIYSSPIYTGSGVAETRTYVYTWVSAYGEEGPPSLPTTYSGWSDDPWVIRLTVPGSSDTTNRNLSKVRIYRTVTGVGGVTTYFFVTELDIATTSYIDTAPSTEVVANNVLQSYYYEAPPSDLEGFAMLPNGIIASWRRNEIWFCEPFLPHAWPSPYTIATEYPIVGMGVIGQSLIVCTTGSPYAVSGVNPSTMAMSRIAVNEPCMSRASIISTAQGVVYASPNGLAVAVPGSVSVVTRNLITKDLWLDEVNYISVPTLRAALLNGSYYAWGSVRSGGFQSDTFQTDSFAQTDYTGAYRGAIIDMNNPRIGWVSLTSSTPVYNCFTDQVTGEVLIIKDGAVYWLDLSKSRTHQVYLWRSKIFESVNKRNYEAMRVWFTGNSDAGTMARSMWDDKLYWSDSSSWTETPGSYGIVRVYADGVLRFTRALSTSGEFLRLPSGFKAQYWEVEVEASINLVSIEMAMTAKDLANG
jgi:hypothetical protein